MTRLTRTSLWTALVVSLTLCLVLGSSAQAKAHAQTDYVASLHTTVVMNSANPLLIGVEAGIAATQARGAQLSIYQYPTFSATCYVEPDQLVIARSLRSASLSASCMVRNTLEYGPTLYQVRLDVAWTATGKKERNTQNGAVGRAATATVTVTVRGAAGDVIRTSQITSGGYLSAIPTH